MPKSFINVLIDFDNDGDWTEAINDVTSDVRSLVRRYGKTLRKQSAEAGTLELILNNDDHRYTPSNPRSALYPLQIPGPTVWARIGYPADDFDADDGTTLTDRVPPYDSLFAAWAGNTGSFEVSSNKLKVTSAGLDVQAVLDFDEADCWVSVAYTRGTGSTAGVIFRYTDANNFWYVTSDGNTLFLRKNVGGVLSVVHNATHSWSLGEEKVITVRLHGTHKEIYVDDQLVMSETADDHNVTATQHGVGGTNCNTDDLWNNFGGIRTIFVGQVDVITVHPQKSEQYAYLKAYDDMERLSRHAVHSTVSTIPADEGHVVTAILDAANVASRQRLIDKPDDGDDLTYDTDNEVMGNPVTKLGRDALTEMYQVQDDAVAFYYVDGAIHRWEPFDHRDTAPHVSPVKRWWNNPRSGGQGEVFYQDIVPDWGKDLIENDGYYVYYKISMAASATEIWKLTDATEYILDRPPVNSGITETFLAIGAGDSVADPVTPFPATDFEINTASDGSGTDLTASQDSEVGTVSATGAAAYQLDDTLQDFTAWNDGDHIIVITDATLRQAIGWIAATDPDGDGTRVDIKTGSDLATAGYAYSDSGFAETDTPLTYNVYQCWAELQSGWEGNFRQLAVRNGSGSNGFITLLRLRGKEGTRSQKRGARFTSTGSANLYGRRRIQHETLHIDRFSEALNRVTERITRRQNLLGLYTVQMQNATRAALMQMIHRNLSDRVRIIDSDMNLVDEAFIEAQRLEVRQGGLSVESEFILLGAPMFTLRRPIALETTLSTEEGITGRENRTTALETTLSTEEGITGRENRTTALETSLSTSVA